MIDRSAVVIGGCSGIGAALAAELTARGNFRKVLALSRSSQPPVDLLDECSIAVAAKYVADASFRPAMIIVATGLLHRDGFRPEKSLRELDPEWMALNYRINAVGPALVAKHFMPLLPRGERTVFAALSARVGSISDNKLGGWHSYRASKAALNMIVCNISIEWQRKNPQSIVVGLHPGTVDTALSAPFRGNPAHERVTPSQAARRLVDVLDRLDPAQSGGLFAYDGTCIAP